ncbi:tRNA uracil 4-sulfurtransferase ThiI [Idiomarina xiamenensis]|uniref:tRNA sulfurtransferase n=1 Tax=Idiomarina xiamenensis 10-D-4 TaxID=740709 RepID=K2KYH0_9GAMM|nr:tRNA s(4)U8 sulfurtransferase [Idiomarina xiamenensis 10-D-4]
MKFVVRLQAEITIKSKSVRKRYGKLLVNNLKLILTPLHPSMRVRWMWDRIDIWADDVAGLAQQVAAKLTDIPGISSFSELIEVPLSSFEEALELTLSHYAERVEGKTFAVRVRRNGHHPFSSKDLERYIGGGINQRVAGTRVKLTQPELEIRLEVQDDKLRLLSDKQVGMGGFPIPSQDTVLSLLSGGYDSSVSTYQMIRRGARTHFCFFNLGGDQHEIAVQQTAHYLWQRYSSSHPLKFVSIDFAPVVEEILTKVDNGLMGVVLKRQMMRAASLTGRLLKAKALVTGEALGQVSSQTLANLQVIDHASDTLVLRPLIVSDKQDIVDMAKQIGTEPLAKAIPEYCGVISNKPTVAARLDQIEAAEAELDNQLIARVVGAANILSMQDIAAQTEAKVGQVDYRRVQDSNTVIIDVRSPDEQERAPLTLAEAEVTHIPFYRLATQFSELDPQKQYLLYCDKGVMSRLQALYLQEQGFSNVAVYQPA